jgi:asparagine synthase (glutamine-hydrolysing)
MSGIIGILRHNGDAVSLNESALVPLRRRGPDGEGFYHDSHISLGHAHLAVLDLSERAKQPMRSFDGRYVVVHNGAIYNSPELRSQLEAFGTRFATRSDAEVVLEAYRHWGKDCVRHFRGMFAFAVWDVLEKKLFLARDRCGERPLAYYRDARQCIFASELKALVPLLPRKPALDPSAVDLYLHYQYTPEPFTLLQGVRKLPAAHTLTLSAAQPLVETECYWRMEDTPDIVGLPTDTPGILRCIRDAVEESVKLALRADVPVAVALSGGIDSGSIAALAQKHSPEPLHAFSVGYPGRPPYDEREQARELAQALGMIFHEVELPIDGFVDFFPDLVRIMDEPIGDPAAFGHYSVPKAVGDMGMKVLLSGIGGDELFWGYDWVIKAAMLNQAAMSGACDCGTDSLRVPEGFLYFYDLAPDFTDARHSLPSAYGPAMRDLPAFNAYAPVNIGPRNAEQIPAAIIRLLFDTWLVGNCLTLGDRVAMGGAGVETRLPFLEPNLIPDHAMGQKAWLRAALKGILPDDVLVRPKRGFQPPVQEWLGGVVRRYGNMLHAGELRHDGIIAPGAETTFCGDAFKLDGSRLMLVYRLVLLEVWLQQLRQSRL